MLIRLFQQATRYSVGACRGHPFLRACANFSVSSPAKRLASSIWQPVAGPMALRVSAVGTSARMNRKTTTLAVRGLPASSVSDVRDDSPQHENPADVVVLGRVFDDDRQTWDLRAFAPASAGTAPIRNGVDDAPQAAPSDGQRGA